MRQRSPVPCGHERPPGDGAGAGPSGLGIWSWWFAWGNALPGIVGLACLGLPVAARAVCVSLFLAACWLGVGRAALGLVTRLVPGEGWPRRLGWVVRGTWAGVVCLVVAAGLLEAWVVLLFGHRIRPPILFVVFETNPREALEFVHMYANHQMAALVLLAGLPWLARGLARGAGGRLRGGARVVAGLGAVVGAGLVAVGSREGDLPLGSFVAAFQQYQVETAAYFELKRALPEPGIAGGLTPTPGPAADELHVLVLGESTGRNHLGLYGYPRPTTPRLSALGDRLVVFRDAVSRQSHTQAAMKELLTFMNQESERPWFEHPTMLAAYRQAGYRTLWVSNQEMYGLWANVTSALASQADVRIFHKNREVRDREDSPLLRDTRDEELLPYVDRILAAPAGRGQLLVVHLMGTHGWYRNRYPPSFARFESSTLPGRDRPWLTWLKARTIDDYDNAVLYNDHVLAELIGRLEASGRVGFLVYLSDHGEEVYDTRDFLGHTEAVGTRHMIEVPLLLWMSEGYRARYPRRAEAARGAVDRPFMTDDLPHLMLDLSGVEHPAFEPSRSPVNEAFDPGRARRYAGRSYDCELREPPAPGCGTPPGAGGP